jgi:2-succinyl-6-hydroxy-2,4-cyclohexadiene-1-carboxylate synthase
VAGALVAVRTGLRLHVEELGAEYDRIRPLLLLHGFTGSSQAWGEEVLEALARSRRVLAVDLPGHGRSDTPPLGDPLHIGCVVADLAHLLDRSGIEKADWLGYSMGGRIALAAALTRPGRVARLILESASPGLADAAERGERRMSDEALAARIEALGVEAFVDEWLAQPLFATQARLPDEVRERERRWRLSNRPEALAACLRGLGTGTQPPFWERLPERRSPTLLITGEHDTRFTGIATRMLAGFAATPDARHVVVPGAGHAVHLEAPGAWLAAVTSFLETI